MVVIGHDGVPLFTDGDILTWDAAHRPEVAVAFARGATATGTGVVPFALAALVGLICAHLGVRWFADVVGGRLFVLGRLIMCPCAVAFWLPTRWTSDATETTDTVRGNKGATRTTRGRTDPAREQ
ncbi:hypothetical protein ACFWP5_09870 [Streptomyces sp. NPDC058469]|uniref:hypothetical protein n=1 Tax=Streptomyces sp. NPDC058469 TaxID=3346514 RepID=UPI0036579448